MRVDARGAWKSPPAAAQTNGNREWAVAAILQDLVGTIASAATVDPGPNRLKLFKSTRPIPPTVPQFQRGLPPLDLRHRLPPTARQADSKPNSSSISTKATPESLASSRTFSAWKLQGTGAGKDSRSATLVQDRFAGERRASTSSKSTSVPRRQGRSGTTRRCASRSKTAGSRLGFEPRSAIETATRRCARPSRHPLGRIARTNQLSSTRIARGFWKINGTGLLEQWAGRLPSVGRRHAGTTGGTVDDQRAASCSVRHVTGRPVENQRAEYSLPRSARRKSTSKESKPPAISRWESGDAAIRPRRPINSAVSIAFGTRDVSIQFTESGLPLRSRRTPPLRPARLPRSTGGVGRTLSAPNLGAGCSARSVRRPAATRQRRGAPTADSHASSEPLQLVNSADGSVAWNEPKVEPLTVATYTVAANDQAQLTNINLTGKTVKMDGSGVVEQVAYRRRRPRRRQLLPTTPAELARRSSPRTLGLERPNHRCEHKPCLQATRDGLYANATPPRGRSRGGDSRRIHSASWR